MNPDTAPIAEVESYLLERGMDILGRSIDAAIACLPPGCRWACNLCDWIVYPPGPLDGRHIEHPRSGDPFADRDELLRLAAKAWQKEESK